MIVQKDGQARKACAAYPVSFILALPAIVFCTILLTGGSAEKADQRPNIIYILADDMGYSDIGCYGGEVHTPNIDRLAANGIKLRNFYNNARCCPTRASLLTGQYPHTVGMGHMVTKPNAKVTPGAYQGYLNDRYPTIAEDLQKAGYRTYMSGKWHVGEKPDYWPLKRGFQRYFGLISGASSYYEIIPQEKGIRRVVLDDKDYAIPDTGFYMTDAFTDYAIQFLDENKKEHGADPFFLYLAYTAPHFPIHAYESDIAKYEKMYLQGWDVLREKRYARMQKMGVIDNRFPLTSRPGDIPEWSTVADKKTWARKMAVYAAMIDRMDQNIGRLIQTLKNNGQYDNTLILFISDNGGCAENVDKRNFNDPTKKIGEKGSYLTYDMPWANVSNTPFKKYKRFMHEGGMISPCIIQWPKKIQPGAGYLNGPAHVIDLLPTALELAGTAANDLPGESLLGLWSGKKNNPRTLYWEHEGNKAIRKGNLKLVRDLEDPAWELYDLSKDPAETNNLAAGKPGLVNDMIAEYQTWAKRVGVKGEREKVRSEK
jgi:arylsulfatase